ncbi:hypothetical protein LIER_14820 [Lithospermum erythrorhizon]|uniref:Replication factor A C-terminal domain-containing protein n=1 Tax=Lithospermum erythrorhizon TaxID=34254 RepID=A0AAV3Q4L8_LITER
MAQTNLLISQISIQTRNWTSRVTITKDIPIMTCGNGKKLKRYILTDYEGNEVAATVFSEQIPFVMPVLHLFKVYDINNAQVKFVPPQYRIINNEHHWILQRDTLIRSVLDESPYLRYFSTNLTLFSSIAKTHFLMLTTLVYIMGIITAIEEPTIANTVNGLKNIQKVTFINMEKILIYVTLWEEMPEIEGPSLIEAANTLSVVIGKCLSLGTYHGDMKIHTIDEINSMTKYGEYWVRGFLQISEEDQKLYYIRCNNYNSKISASEEGIKYTCYACRKEVLTTARPLVFMSITDESGMLKVVAIDDVAEQILQTNASDLLRLMNMEAQQNRNCPW